MAPGSLLGGHLLEGRMAASAVVALIGKEFGDVLQQADGWDINAGAAKGGEHSAIDQSLSDGAGTPNLTDASPRP
jgi:hypothetical protein